MRVYAILMHCCKPKMLIFESWNLEPFSLHQRPMCGFSKFYNWNLLCSGLKLSFALISKYFTWILCLKSAASFHYKYWTGKHILYLLSWLKIVDKKPYPCLNLLPILSTLSGNPFLLISVNLKKIPCPVSNFHVSLCFYFLSLHLLQSLYSILQFYHCF